MAGQFTAPYQSIYEAGLARLRENEARRRALALGGAARAGVATSGVGQVPQEAISREAARGEADLGADVARQAEEERLQKERFEQQKEMMRLQYGLSEAAAARLRDWQRRNAGSGITSQVIGGLAGGVGSALAKKYF